MATFSAQIVSLIGGTVAQTELDVWCTEGARDVINNLPANLLERCSDVTSITDANGFSFETATRGKVSYCTRSNGTYDIPCRLESPQNAGLLDDSSSDVHYASADDPAYFIRDNLLEIKPNPDSSGQTGKVYHIIYPSSIDADNDSTIANFPEEAEYLVVLYAATKQLLQYMSDMSADYDDDIEDAFNRAKTLMTDSTSFNALSTVIDDVTNVSALYQLGQEDTELVASTLSLVATELSRASGMMGADAQQYAWYVDQYAKLSGDYTRGLATLKGG